MSGMIPNHNLRQCVLLVGQHVVQKCAVQIRKQKDRRAHIKTGEKNNLMRNLSIDNHKVYKEFRAALSAGRMETESQHDLVGFTVMANQQGAIEDDYVLGMCADELAPDAQLTITAADLSKAYLQGSDPDMLSCPILAPKGQTADDMIAKLDQDLGIDSSASHSEVIEAMENATDSMWNSTLEFHLELSLFQSVKVSLSL